MSFIRTGLREIGLKIRRQRTRMVLRHEKRLLQKSEIILGREGTSQAANFPELRNEIVALKKLEQEQKEVALRIAQIDCVQIAAAFSKLPRKIVVPIDEGNFLQEFEDLGLHW